jgi:hypothetical protein
VLQQHLPSYVNICAFQEGASTLNEAGYLTVNDAFGRDFVTRLTDEYMLPYDRLSVRVESSIYTDDQFQRLISTLVGCEVMTCARIDRQTSWVRHYTSNLSFNPFSHFHIDLNRYHGRQFRLIINLFDDSDCEFQYMTRDGSIVAQKTVSNSLSIIEAGRLRHRVKMTRGTRLLLMMDFTTTRTRGCLGWFAFTWDYVWMTCVASRLRTHVDAASIAVEGAE